jgi:LmbE family N-acetylglucosaminyl deacetylase
MHAAQHDTRTAEHFATQALVQVWRRALLARGRDVTAETAGRSCLVLAPHPDDETFGCGATICRKLAGGSEVRIVVATDGRLSSDRMDPDALARLRSGEVRAATRELGIADDDLLLLGHHDGTLVRCTDRVVEEVGALVAGRVPDQVYVTSALDGHPDHVALNEVARQLRTQWSGSCEFLEYPTWYWYQGPVRTSARSAWRRTARGVEQVLSSARRFRPGLVATGPYLGPKRRAIECYRSQTQDLSGDGEWEHLPSDFVSAFLGGFEVFLPLP